MLRVGAPLKLSVPPRARYMLPIWREAALFRDTPRHAGSVSQPKPRRTALTDVCAAERMP